MSDFVAVQQVIDICKDGLLKLQQLKESAPAEFASLRVELLSLVATKLCLTIGDRHTMDKEQYRELHQITSNLQSF